VVVELRLVVVTVVLGMEEVVVVELMVVVVVVSPGHKHGGLEQLQGSSSPALTHLLAAFFLQ